MAFPQSILPIRQEILINGVWTDITSRTRNADDIVISRGFGPEQAPNLTAASASMTLDNRDKNDGNGRFFSNRRPDSVNYGLIGPNTQYRVSVLESVPSVRLKDYNVNATSSNTYDGAEVSTTDKAVLDITGDIDVRIDMQPDNWQGCADQILISKFVLTASNNRSWRLRLTATGTLRFTWSADGTNTLGAESTAVAATSGRLAVRVTLDVNNGAGGNTCTFYTSDSVTGTWTQLGSAIVTAGTTSIFSSSAPLEIGEEDNAGIRFTNIVPFTGRIYRAQVYSGIAGTLVADMNATAQAEGATSWSDGLATPNTWTLAASAVITKADYRFWGEIPEFPQDWDTTGVDVTARANAADIVQRITQGAKPLKSPIYYNLSQYVTTSTTPGMDGWWPMEDGSLATQASAVIGNAATFTNAGFGSDVALLGAAGVLQFSSDSGIAYGSTAGTVANTGTAYNLWYFKMPAVPGSTLRTISFTYAGGSVAKATLDISATQFTLSIFAADGTLLANTATGFGAGVSPDQWMAMRLLQTQSGGTVNWALAWYQVSSATPFGISGSFSGTCGRPVGWKSETWTGKLGYELAHVALARSDLGLVSTAFTESTNGYAGERVSERFARLCVQQGIPFFVVGDRSDANQLTMGPQSTISFPSLLQEIIDLDGGFIYGPRDKFGLTFRMRNSFLNRTGVQLSYSSRHLTDLGRPDEGTAFIRNDVTVSRPNGGSARWFLDSGPRNVHESSVDPNGVGQLDVELSKNTDADNQLLPLAQDEVFRGTWDELRYPSVSVELARTVMVANPTLTAAVRALDVAGVVTLTGLPNWLPPDNVDQLIRGYVETLRNRGQQFAFTLIPYGPYVTGVYDDATKRYDSSSTTLKTTVNSSAISLTFVTPATENATWSTSGTDLPYPVTISGQVNTVTAMGAPSLVSGSYEQVATVTRGINGITKGLTAGAAIHVTYPGRYALGGSLT